MTRLKFIGTRQFDFSVAGPITGAVCYVSPSAGDIIEVDEQDAVVLLERDPHLWERVALDADTPTKSRAKKD